MDHGKTIVTVFGGEIWPCLWQVMGMGIDF